MRDLESSPWNDKMRADCPRILIAGDRSSSGKTTIVAGLLSALCNKGQKVQPFKVAMDYIDPELPHLDHRQKLPQPGRLPHDTGSR